MKKSTLVFFGILLFFGKMQAQDNLLKIHPLHLLSLKAEYERKLSSNWSVGAIGDGYFMYSGFRVEPYFRYYLKHDDTKGAFIGPYIQGKFHYSRAIDKSSENEIISEYGFSADFGYQINLGSNFSLDLFTGYRTSFFNYPSTSESSSAFKSLYCSPWDLGISLGYSFGAPPIKQHQRTHS
jgi:hypothetical protein